MIHFWYTMQNRHKNYLVGMKEIEAVVSFLGTKKYIAFCAFYKTLQLTSRPHASHATFSFYLVVTKIITTNVNSR